jgi:hypothetical protein
MTKLVFETLIKKFTSSSHGKEEANMPDYEPLTFWHWSFTFNSNKLPT